MGRAACSFSGISLSVEPQSVGTGEGKRTFAIQTGSGVRTSLARAFDRAGAKALRAIERRRKSKIDFGFAELRSRQEAQNIHVRPRVI
jgi:hypothetical protein